MSQNRTTEDNARIYIRVYDVRDETVMYFSIRKQNPLMKIMNAYCERTGKDITTIKFKFDGQDIETHTPFSLEMEDGDVIEICQAIENN